MNSRSIHWTPQALSLISALFFIYPFVTETLYKNICFATGIFLLFSAWLAANLLKMEDLKDRGRWDEQKKVMYAMLICLSVGAVLLVYYEAKMPKYSIAVTKKELYRVPPQLNKHQLKELGSECNTYGNTLCSHDVFAKIVKMDSRDYRALGNLAMAQTHLGFHKFAIENFKTVIKNKAATYDIYRFLGDALLKLDKPEEALKAYKKSLKMNPKQSSLKTKINNFTKQRHSL